MNIIVGVHFDEPLMWYDFNLFQYVLNIMSVMCLGIGNNGLNYWFGVVGTECKN